MTTDTATDDTTTTVRHDSGPLWFRPAGRHRKPRHRRLALAVGGFALAAGALSLVRLAPESVTGGGGTAEAEPRIDASDTAATVEDLPSKGHGEPSTTALKGRASAVPAGTDGASPSSGPPSSAPPRVTDPATGIPEAAESPTASRTPEPPVTTTAAPPPAPSPTATTRAPSAPPSADPAGLCVPLVGLCVHGL